MLFFSWIQDRGSCSGVHKPAWGEADRQANVLCVPLFFSGEKAYSFYYIPKRVWTSPKVGNRWTLSLEAETGVLHVSCPQHSWATAGPGSFRSPPLSAALGTQKAFSNEPGIEFHWNLAAMSWPGTVRSLMLPACPHSIQRCPWLKDFQITSLVQ